MILTPAERIQRYVGQGAWTRVTVDKLFRRALAADPAGLFLAEMRGFGDGVRRLGFAEAHQRIEALAGFFAGHGMRPDNVLAIHLPPSVDAAVVVLAALRAGLIICPLPLHATGAEVDSLAETAGIRGIVTTDLPFPDGYRTDAVGRIRHRFGLGPEIPGGAVDLSPILAENSGFSPAPDILRRGDPADHVAFLSVVRDREGRPVAVPFSHNHLVAGALANLLAARPERPEMVVSTMHPASLATLVGAVLVALVSGGSVGFHQPADMAELAHAAAAMNADRVLLPAALAPEISGFLRPGTALSLVSTGLEPDLGSPALAGGCQVMDLVTLGGFCLLPLPRPAPGGRARLPFGAVRYPPGGDGAILVEARVKSRVVPGSPTGHSSGGELLLSGPLVPDAPWPEPTSGASGAVLAFAADGALRTGIIADVVGEGAAALLHLRPGAGDSLLVAGHPVSVARLDTLIRSHPAVADAAVFPIAADLVGTRIGVAIVPRDGLAIDLASLDAHLDRCGLGALERPSSLAVVAAIPRSGDGAVLGRPSLKIAVA